MQKEENMIFVKFGHYSRNQRFISLYRLMSHHFPFFIALWPKEDCFNSLQLTIRVHVGLGGRCVVCGITEASLRHALGCSYQTRFLCDAGAWSESDSILRILHGSILEACTANGSSAAWPVSFKRKFCCNPQISLLKRRFSKPSASHVEIRLWCITNIWKRATQATKTTKAGKPQVG